MASQLPEAGRMCLHQLRTSAVQTRSFSCSVARRRNGPIASFPPTSSAELDEILSTLRNNVFVPNHLRVAQRHLVYRKHFQHYLTGEEPVTVELPTLSPVKTAHSDDSSATEPKESFTLQPLNKVRDEPRHAKTFNRIIDLMRDNPDAWIIVPQLLRELHISKRVVRPKQVEKLVRRAAAEGKLGMIIECFRRVDDLDLRLSTSGIARQVMLGAHRQALSSSWDHQQLDKEIKHARTTLLLIEDRRHVRVDQKDDPKKCPDIYGSAMALVAARRRLWQAAKKRQEAAVGREDSEMVAGTDAEQVTEESKEPYSEGKNDIASVSEYANKLLELSEFAELDFNDKVYREACAVLDRWLPTWFGIQVAQKVLPAESPLKKRLKGAFEGDVDPTIQKAMDAITNLAGDGSRSSQTGMLKGYREFLDKDI